jgi:hypothetical protein
MSSRGRNGREVGSGRAKRALGAQAALEWAFRVEKVQLELPPPKGAAEEAHGYGLEYVLLRRAALGCRIDGGQHKKGGFVHPDAEVIAATVAALPDSLGGRRMAIRVAELATAGLTPDWMPGATPRCVPALVPGNQHGERGDVVVVGHERIRVRGLKSRITWQTIELLACPVRFTPHPQQIEAAREGYEEWWQALGWIRDGLSEGGMLREVEVMEVMPKMMPWAEKDPGLSGKA